MKIFWNIPSSGSSTNEELSILKKVSLKFVRKKKNFQLKDVLMITGAVESLGQITKTNRLLS